MQNYHTHTFRCKHAEGDVIDYARKAVEEKISVLGISDHTALPDDRWVGMRMAYAELADYIEAIEFARSEYPELTILKGMECEWTPQYHAFFRDELLGEYDFDYLILGCHYFSYNGAFVSSHSGIHSPRRLKAYAEFLISSMQSGLFDFVAHPDLFGLTYLSWDENATAASRDILSAAEQLNLPLEINGYGLCEKIISTPNGPRPAYPWLPFWRLAREYDVTVVVNSDAHHPEHVNNCLAEGRRLVENLGLKMADLNHLHRR